MASLYNLYRTTALLVALLAACAPSESTPNMCWTPLDDEALGDSAQIDWTPIGEPMIDDSGIAQTVQVPLGADTQGMALRVSDPDGSPACVQLQEVVDPGAGAWVTPPASLEDYRSYCRSCPERVSVGVGGGLYVLPSGDPPPPPAASLLVRAAVRDCATFLPPQPAMPRAERLRIEALGLPEIDPAREGIVLLEVIITEGSILYGDPNALPPVLVDALAGVNAMLAPGKLRVVPVRVRRAKTEDPLAIERGEHAALDRLHGEAHACDAGGVAPDDTWVPLVLAGCIALSDPVQMTAEEPNGYVPRIPDGMPPPGRGHGIFIKGRDCDDTASRIDRPPDSLAKLIAHELGHYLGLYHTVEPDGGLDDLDDTGADNVMHWVSPTMTLTAGQFHVMRRHPSVRWH